MSIAFSFAVAAQPALVNVNEFELEYEAADSGRHIARKDGP